MNDRRRPSRWTHLLPLFVVLTWVLTGCARFDGEVTIGTDRVDMSFFLGIRAEYATGDPQSLCAEPAQALKGSLIKSESQAGYVGCRVSGWLTLDDFVNGPQGGFLVEEKDGIYTFSTTASTSTDVSYLESFSMRVTFPGEVVDHSGSSAVSGRTVTWTSASDLASGLSASGRAQAPGPNPAIVILLVVVAAAVVLGALAYRHRSRVQAAQGSGGGPSIEQRPAGGPTYPSALVGPPSSAHTWAKSCKRCGRPMGSDHAFCTVCGQRA